MKLSFLGRSYEASAPTVETTTTQHSGQFLGQSFTLSQSSATPQHRTWLRYRGVDYTK